MVLARSRVSAPSARGHYLTLASPAAAPISFDPEGISGDSETDMLPYSSVRGCSLHSQAHTHTHTHARAYMHMQA